DFLVTLTLLTCRRFHQTNTVDSWRESTMGRHMKQLSWLTLSALLFGAPATTHAAEAPGGLTVLVEDQITDRPLSNARITLTERETNATRSADTDAQGRIVVEQLDPGLYALDVTRDGFASSTEPSVRV